MTIKLIIFDFDGTIADTYQAVVDITNNLSTEFGYQPLDSETLQLFKNLSSREIVNRSQISLFKLTFLVKRVQSELGKQIVDLEPILGMPETLKELKDRKYSLGIVTSNAKENVMAFLAKQKLVHFFDFIYSEKNIFGKHRIINRTINNYNLAKEEVVYIGDETRDIRSAKKSKIPVIAVVWGFNAKAILQEHQPNFLATRPQEILEAVEQFK